MELKLEAEEVHIRGIQGKCRLIWKWSNGNTMLTVGHGLFREGTSQEMQQVMEEVQEGLDTWARARNVRIVLFHRRVIQTIYKNKVIGRR